MILIVVLWKSSLSRYFFTSLSILPKTRILLEPYRNKACLTVKLALHFYQPCQNSLVTTIHNRFNLFCWSAALTKWRLEVFDIMRHLHA
jgi:hypothetical protein